MKKVISYILIVIVIAIAGYLAVANVIHMFYLNRCEVFDSNSEAMKTVKTNLKDLKDNMAKLKEFTTDTISSEDLQLLKNSLNDMVTNMEQYSLLTYEGTKRMCYTDFVEMDTDFRNSSNELSILNVLPKYDESIKDYIEVYKSSWVSYAFGANESIIKPMRAYQYQTYDIFASSSVLDVENYNVLTRVYWLNDRIVKTNYIVKLVLQLGGAANE